MGKFIYDSSTKTDFEDRLLAHLQIVIMSKARRGESFTFTWKDDMSTGGGRTTVFIHPHASLQFKYHGGKQPQVNPAWVAALTLNANSPRGLYVVREPDTRGGETSAHGEMLFGEIVR